MPAIAVNGQWLLLWADKKTELWLCDDLSCHCYAVYIRCRFPNFQMMVMYRNSSSLVQFSPQQIKCYVDKLCCWWLWCWNPLFSSDGRGWAPQWQSADGTGVCASGVPAVALFPSHFVLISVSSTCWWWKAGDYLMLIWGMSWNPE